MAQSRLVRIVVEGAVAFPIDMLRYDSAWPERETDSSAIWSTLPHGGRDRVRVTLLSTRVPTPSRWESFLWRVVESGLA